MRISRDVTFDESRPFYPRPSPDASQASVIEPLSFLLFPDTPIAPMFPSHLVPSSEEPSSTAPSPVVPSFSDDIPQVPMGTTYDSKPPVTRVYTRTRRAVISSSDVPSSLDEPSSSAAPSDAETAPSDVETAPRYVLRDRQSLRPPDRLGFAGTVLSEPTSYRDAIQHQEWQHAMAEELAALERTGTWDLVPIPAHVRPITCKWVYKVKTRSDGSLECYKARLVARGF